MSNFLKPPSRSRGISFVQIESGDSSPGSSSETQ